MTPPPRKSIGRIVEYDERRKSRLPYLSPPVSRPVRKFPPSLPPSRFDDNDDDVVECAHRHRQRGGNFPSLSGSRRDILPHPLSFVPLSYSSYSSSSSRAAMPNPDEQRPPGHPLTQRRRIPLWFIWNDKRVARELEFGSAGGGGGGKRPTNYVLPAKKNETGEFLLKTPLLAATGRLYVLSMAEGEYRNTDQTEEELCSNRANA